MRFLRMGTNNAPRPFGQGHSGRPVRPMGPNPSSVYCTHRMYSADGSSLWTADHGNRVLAVAIGPDGSIFTSSVGDTSTGFIAPKLEYGGGGLSKWSTTGGLQWRLRLPGDAAGLDVAVDSGGNSWVITETDCYKVSPSGSILLAFDQSAISGAAPLNSYRRVLVDSLDNIVISGEATTASIAGAVHTYSTTGAFLGGALFDGFTTGGDVVSMRGMALRQSDNHVFVTCYLSSGTDASVIVEFAATSGGSMAFVNNYFWSFADSLGLLPMGAFGLAHHAGSDTCLSAYGFGGAGSPFPNGQNVVEWASDLSSWTELAPSGDFPVYNDAISVNASRRYVHAQYALGSPSSVNGQFNTHVVREYPGTLLWGANHSVHPYTTSLGATVYGHVYDTHIFDDGKVLIGGDRMYVS